MRHCCSDYGVDVAAIFLCSPEVVKGVKYDFKSDMWSMGCLLYELAMLKSPFEVRAAGQVTPGDTIAR